MNVYLIWLEWPEKCFRVDAEALRRLKSLVPTGSRVIRARDEAEFLRKLPSATHAIVWNFRKEWFAQAPKLKVLATPGAGRELVTREVPKGVTLHFGGFHGAIMAESVAAFVLAWARGFFLAQPDGWPRTWMSDKCYTVAGTRAVVLGYGRVGRAIGAKLESLGVEVFGYARHLRIATSAFNAKLKKADWLVMALPSDTGTDDILDAKLLAKLNPRCCVINVGRGNSIDERSLLKALRDGTVAGAYLDVFKDEPSFFRGIPKTKSDGVILGTAPAKLPRNLIRMPHSSAFSGNYVKMAFEELAHDGVL